MRHRSLLDLAARLVAVGLLTSVLAACGSRASGPPAGPVAEPSGHTAPDNFTGLTPEARSPASSTTDSGRRAAVAVEAPLGSALPPPASSVASSASAAGGPAYRAERSSAASWKSSDGDREQYQWLPANPQQSVATAPVSTFSVDVDTGSWSNIRRLLNAGRLPPSAAVRIEEMINYFPYDDPRPRDAEPFAVHASLATAPWNPRRWLLRVVLAAENRAMETLPPANLVFLVDVSGSMASPDKLPLLQSSLKILATRLRSQDRVSLVSYAGSTAIVLPATSGAERARIVAAIDSLRAGGATAGESGLELAYRTAREGFIDGGINRILLATDGDFNVGVADFRQLKEIVAARRSSGISLSTLGFGTGNYNERLMEQLADAGDGAYSYIDNLMEGQKVLVTEMTSTLATVARDVKAQVEFNPRVVSSYRLLGYENRMLAREDFDDDRMDAGDIGAGHAVTAIYELVPAGESGGLDPLRYGRAADAVPASDNSAVTDEVAYVRLRYKRPGESASRLMERAVGRRPLASIDAAPADFRFAVAIAGFGQLLRGGTSTADWRIDDARRLAAASLGDDRFGYRAEALRLMDLAQALQSR